MPSPHFPLRREPLERVFSETHLLKLWKNKVRSFQRNQLLFDLYEYLDFHEQRKEAVADICRTVLSGTYKPSSEIRVSVEKSKGICRHLNVPNCKDALVLQALSDALYKSIKSAAPTKKAYFEQKENPFLRPSDANEYGTLASWKKFQTALLGFSKKKRFVVITDIANFYDFIGHRQLRSIVSNICDRNSEVILDALIHCLGAMTWRAEYMPDPEMGLPQMDSDAPRILAHSFLYEADKFLDSNKHIEFARFMDDIDIGVNSIPEAKSVLRDLDITLKSRGVRLNSGKTYILTSAEAQSFFWARENEVLTKIMNIVELGATKNRLAVRIIIDRFKKQYRRHKFAYGNGEKILKRYIGLFSKLKISLPTIIIEDILKNRPAVRQNIFWHVSLFGLKNTVLNFCADMLKSGHWVDDASSFHLATYLVQCTYKNNSKRKKKILEIAHILLASESKSRFISGVWISSKYMSDEDLYDVCQTYRRVWASDGEIGRIIGALAPRMTGKEVRASFHLLVLRSYNKEAIAAVRFGAKIQNDATLVNRLMPTLKAVNPSLPNKISHPKAIMVAAARKNTNVTTAQLAQLSVHTFMSTDDAYKKFLA